MVFTRSLYKQLGVFIEDKLQEEKRTRRPRMSKKDDQEGNTHEGLFPSTTDERVAMLEGQMGSIQSSLDQL